jgi:hypothetical protein
MTKVVLMRYLLPKYDAFFIPQTCGTEGVSYLFRSLKQCI